MKIRTKFFSFFFILFLFSGITYSQISVDIKPLSNTVPLTKEVPVITMPSFDVNKFLREDAFESQFKDIPPRFGNPMTVNFGYPKSGVTEVLLDGTKIWRLEIKSPGAISINLIFDKFYLPKGTTFYVYNKNKSSVIGAFTDANNSQLKKFATQPVTGDDIVLEYNSPYYNIEQPEINLSTVIHAYKNIFNFLKEKDYGQSGTCNRNVICPEGDPYRDQIRAAVMMMTSSNSRFCSGSLVNNTRYDGTPYVLTANHCWDSSQPTWVVMFNYQAPTCPNPGGDGPTTMTISGTTLCGKNSYSDFCLVKLSSRPPALWNVFYNGWSRLYDRPSGGFGIHFPNCDVKKISFSTTQYTPTSYYNPAVPGDSTHWHVTWAQIPSTGLTPITEPGSSGSPVYDQNKRVVGQLHGGPSSCTATDKSDYYGRFCESWGRGTTPDTRLRDWLDSANTGVWVIDGYDPNSGPLNAFNLQAPSAGITVTTIAGSNTLYTFNWDTSTAAASYKWIFGSSLPTRLLTVPVPVKPWTPTLGQLDAYIASLGVSQGNSISGSWDVWAFRNNPPNNDSLKATNGPRTITFTRQLPTLSAFNLSYPATGFSVTTIAGSTTPVNFTWTRSGSGTTYKWLYKTGSSYSDPATLRLASNNSGFDSVLTMTIGQIDAYLAGLGLGLGDSITGYWRVRAFTASDSVTSTAPDRQITFRRALFSSLVVSGNLAATDSSFTRPNANTPSNIPPATMSTTTAYFDKTYFKVSNTGHYYIYSAASYDNYLLLYQNGFNRLSPLTNAIGGNDDTTGTWMPEFTASLARSAVNDINLVANVTYILINTTYSASVTGNWKDSIWGPGAITQIITSVTPYGTLIPTDYALKQNYPNPFNPVTKISYDLPKQGFVSLKVYDMLGREIVTLVNEVKKEGSYIVDFDGSNLSSGAYFFKLKANDFVDVKKMILLK